MHWSFWEGKQEPHFGRGEVTCKIAKIPVWVSGTQGKK